MLHWQVVEHIQPITFVKIYIKIYVTNQNPLSGEDNVNINIWPIKS